MSALKFVPFSSEIELPFYSALFSLKLDHDKLDDSARPVLGLYEPQPQADPESSTKMQIRGNALTSNDVPAGMCRAKGYIKNVNTIEEFRNIDKNAMITDLGRQIWEAIQDGTIYSVPSLLSSFAILSFADLKKYRFTYWFAFPALHSDPPWKRVGAIGHLDSKESTALVDAVMTWRYVVSNEAEHGFFLAKKVRDRDAAAKSFLDDYAADLGYRWEIASLREFENGFFNNTDEADRYVAFVDPSNYDESPSWPLRNLLVLIRQRYRLKKVNILCYRDTQAKRHEARSIILPLEMEGTVDQAAPQKMPNVTGWERDVNNKLRARVANLADHMNPTRLADQAVDLNLKLMKWRLAPNLNLDGIKNTKCLLLGAGTLGSYVSRNLMGWGVRTITFVDNGAVSFSNPVRQPLFNFQDCLQGGKPKALRAAEALKEIYPGVEAGGYVLSVPMLGHPILDEKKVKRDFELLHKLVDEHDAIFLLMDTRESRWLPTVMGKAANKIVMNAALGFDTYVVMRHGAEPEDGSQETLGCYFCNDVVVAANSVKDQTLDQQCTVTRPGVAAIASAMLVELLSSLLQHPKKHHAPAPVPAPGSTTTYARDPEDHPLGLIPHQIRGFLSTWQNIVIHGKSYPQCSACSKSIIDAYRKEGWEFVKRALNSRDYVAELSGLAEVQRQAEKVAAELQWDDEDDGSAEAEEGDGVLI